MRKYAAKVDSNQGPIVEGLRQIFGPDCIIDTSRVGGGFPDLLLGVRGVNLLIEIKTDKGKLTPDQQYLHRYWPGQIAVARTIQEALSAVEKHTLS